MISQLILQLLEKTLHFIVNAQKAEPEEQAHETANISNEAVVIVDGILLPDVDKLIHNPECHFQF